MFWCLLSVKLCSICRGSYGNSSCFCSISTCCEILYVCSHKRTDPPWTFFVLIRGIIYTHSVWLSFLLCGHTRSGTQSSKCVAYCGLDGGLVTLFVRWYFEPSQPQMIISGLKTTFSLSPSHSAHRSSNRKFSKVYKVSPDTDSHKNKSYTHKRETQWVGSLAVLFALSWLSIVTSLVRHPKAW